MPNTTAPTIVVEDSSLTIGETSQVTFTFSEAVTGFTLGDLSVTDGTLSGFSATADPLVYTATLTPVSGINAATGVVSLAAGSVTDLSGNAIAGAQSNTYAVDTLAPSAAVSLSTGHLMAGETATVTLSFSEAITGLTAADFTITDATLSGLTQTANPLVWTATLTPDAGTIATGELDFDSRGVADLAGNPASGVLSLTFDIDTVRPTATVAVDHTTLTGNQTATVTVTFSEAVTGFAINDLTVGHGSLSALSTSDHGVTWTATLTPDAGITATGDVVALDTAGVTNADGNTGAGVVSSIPYDIDTQAPTATVHLANHDLHPGDTSVVTITFSEAVTGFDAAHLTAENGVLSGLATTDNITWTAVFTPANHVTDPTNVVTVDLTGLEDQYGNLSSGAAASENYAVATAPVTPPPPPPPAGPETLTGGAGGDHLTAGPSGDSITGQAGADTIAGGVGNDVLQGNTGADSVSAGAGDDLIYGGQDNDSLQGNIGGDRLFGDKGADAVFGGQGADTLQGGQDADTVSGDKGDDLVVGGQGDDVVMGGDGADTLSGDLGADTLTGGAGADVFHSFAATGTDLITDFNAAEGDRLMLDPGTTYTLSQQGADIIVTMTGGGEVILANVQLSSLSAGWIVA